MPFDKQEGGERTDGKGSEVKFVRLDLAQQPATNCDAFKFHRRAHGERGGIKKK
jgi:hypothetical protein